MSNSHLMATKNGFVSDTKRMPIRHVIHFLFGKLYCILSTTIYTCLWWAQHVFFKKFGRDASCVLCYIHVNTKMNGNFEGKSFFLYFNILRFQASVILLFLLFSKSKIFFVFDSNLDICMAEWISLWYLCLFNMIE